MINVSMLSNQDYELYKKAENEISEKHPMKCICGRLCTGLHEMNCKKFKDTVERKYLRLKKLQEKQNNEF